MKQINVIVGIIAKGLQVEEEIVKKSIRRNDSKEYGDYSVLCYMLKNHFKESPLIIAKKISYILKENNINSFQLVGPYINLYIEKEKILENIFSEFKIEGLSIPSDENIMIINKMKSGSTVIELNDLYKMIIKEFIEKLYREQGYNLECYNPIGEMKKVVSVDYILNKIRSQGLIKSYAAEEIVELKEFNLPPLMIRDKGYNLTLQDLAYPLQRAADRNTTKVIIITNKYENMRYKQIHCLVKKLDSEAVEKLARVSLGFIKLNENIKKYTSYEKDIIKILIKRSKEEVFLAVEKSKLNIKEIDLEKMAIENLIFKFFKKDIGNDLIFDYNESFSIKDNSYLKMKVMEDYLHKNINKQQREELCLDYRCIDLKDRLELINIIEEYLKAIESSRKNHSCLKIIQLIDDVLDKIFIGYGEKIDNEKINLYIAICYVVESAFNMLGISNEMLINKIQKLTVY